MAKIGSENERHCELCHKVLYGRSDQRFCNDACRNTFNRARSLRDQQTANENIPGIFKIIKSNYEVLKRLGPPDTETGVLITKGRPEDEGINQKFITSIEQDGDQLWRFCFEYGWRVFDSDEGWEICWRPEQAEIDI